ncbi:MAG: GAF domain-containing protein [Anaerolineales bacterium]|nr:GAF domain-containing protein [Anaerolineales bacterium]
MGHSIRGRIILVFIGMAIGPLLIIGIILAWLTNPSMQQQALTGASDPSGTLMIVTLILAVVMAGIAGALGFMFARRLLEPIQALTEAADAIGAGDLTARPLIPSDDEIGILAGTFNNMARKLRDRIGTLEHQAADRKKALSTFREVSRLATLLDDKRLAAEVVDQVKTAFHYYHARIFLYDEAGGNLIPAGGAGEAGPVLPGGGRTIPRAAGRAAESNAPVLIGDTSQDPDWLPDPLLPKTRSEIAVPIALGDRVLGVLDVQHNIANGVTQADVDLLQSLANQVAVAVRHARPDTEGPQQVERKALIASIGRRIRETSTVKNALQVAERELGRALGSKKMRVVLSASPQAGQAEAESQPGGN